NLLSNAVKFTQSGGEVRIRLGRTAARAEISVADTGQGIRPQFLPYVFDRFRQAEPHSTSRQGGLGIGLSIVKQLVEMHGGTVVAKSYGEGQGSTFPVPLPLAAVEGGRAARSSARPTQADDPDDHEALAGVRVLVVDDEPDARDIIRRLLEDC